MFSSSLGRKAINSCDHIEKWKLQEERVIPLSLVKILMYTRINQYLRVTKLVVEYLVRFKRRTQSNSHSNFIIKPSIEDIQKYKTQKFIYNQMIP